jgi:hypothetical protein
MVLLVFPCGTGIILRGKHPRTAAADNSGTRRNHIRLAACSLGLVV